MNYQDICLLEILWFSVSPQITAVISIMIFIFKIIVVEERNKLLVTTIVSCSIIY